MDESLFVLDDDPDHPKPSASSNTDPKQGAEPITFDSGVFELQERVALGVSNIGDIYNVAKILVDKKPPNTPTIPTLQSIAESGLTDANVLAMTGKAAFNVINNPKDSGPLTKHLYLLPPSPTFTDPKQVSAEQLCFLALFHHLHFLVVIRSPGNVPAFTDSFKEKYEFLQNTLNEEEGGSLPAVAIKDPKLASLWTALQEKTQAKTRIEVTNIIHRIKSGPKAVYEYISGTASSEAPVAEPSVAKPAVAKPAVAKPAVAEPSVAEPSVAKPAVAEPSASPIAPIPAGPNTVIDDGKSASSFHPSETTRQGFERMDTPEGHLNTIYETNNESNIPREIESNYTNNSSVSSQAVELQPEEVFLGKNREGHDIRPGSRVLYTKNPKNPEVVYTVKSILGISDTPINERRVAIGVAQDGKIPTRLIRAASKNLLVIDAKKTTQKGSNTATSQNKARKITHKIQKSNKSRSSGGRRNITRKKNRTV